MVYENMPNNRLCNTQATRSYPNNKKKNVESGTSSGVMEPLNSIRERYQRGSQHIHNKVRSDLKQSMEKERNNVERNVDMLCQAKQIFQNFTEHVRKKDEIIKTSMENLRTLTKELEQSANDPRKKLFEQRLTQFLTKLEN